MFLLLNINKIDRKKKNDIIWGRRPKLNTEYERKKTRRNDPRVADDAGWIRK